jgi:NADH:ubiquinone reductase (H+-translocating)
MARSRVVIIGAGFGGLSAARALRKAEADVLVVDRHNYHLFQPLLYQVASGLLDPAEIAHPVRSILRGHRNTDVRMEEVRGIDLERKVVRADVDIPYDYLIVAAGAVTNHFGNQDIATHTVGLKGLNDALSLRATVLRRFESAAESTDARERAHLLTFVIAGGGPTGVEYAGALSELFRHLLPKDFPRLDFAPVRVVLVQGSGRLLDAFHPRLGAMAAGVLRRRQVELVPDRLVVGADDRGIILDDGSRIDAATVIWTAGVRAAPLGEQLGETTRSGRVVVRDTLQLPGHDEVQVVGDLAELRDKGELLPMLAPVAIQQGIHAGRNVIAMIEGGAPTSFRYRDKGTMATVGRNYAVVQIGRIRVAGFVGWLMWLFVHLTYIITFRSKAVILINWAWNYVFYDRPVRLITQAYPDRSVDTVSPAPPPDGDSPMAEVKRRH